MECVAAVTRLGSMRRASEALHLSRPALSQTISDLERELGVTLLDRHRAGARISAGCGRATSCTATSTACWTGGSRRSPTPSTGAEMGKIMIAEGLGVTLLPDYSVAGDPLELTGVITRLETEGPGVLLVAEHARTRHLPGHVDRMIRLLRSQAARLLGGEGEDGDALAAPPVKPGPAFRSC
ncbi:LysR family transcriptional regulator [Actinomadura sp. WMMA1423]|uniref:helix-turn-helix domain-containing protein n=1 Tax=Actinomadura sp. WMMA1423 TaxID=2591108 RepID=UPI001F0D5D99|nr:LysR family transcriptional regulator [Actinomadura sp. WMMA1423]